MHRTVVSILLVMLVMSMFPPVVQATSQVDPFYGSFGNEVPFAVPPFHSIEPRLKLNYSSTGKSGFAGVGWDLVGFSLIERMSSGGGAPRLDASDVYYLDGQLLVASTSMGGTHATNIQSYMRIQKDVPSAGQWTVIQRDGTRRVFSAIKTLGATVCNTCAIAGSCTVTSCGSCGQVCTGGFDKFGTCIGLSCNTCMVTNSATCGTISARSCTSCGSSAVSGTVKWGLSSVVDTNGNTVNYAWSCPSDGECYPASATYNGVTITLWREARSDSGSFANGLGLGNRTFRLKSITVSLGSALVRAYKLTYATSASTARSLLAGVQQFGRDATVDASGNISGGTSLPAMSFGYQAGGSATNTCYQTCYDACPPACDKFGCAAPVNTCNPHNCNPYTCSSFLEKTDEAISGADFSNSSSKFPVVPGDWNGDGRMDFARLAGGGAYVFLSTGTGFTRSFDANTGWGFGDTDASFAALSGDWNGDGKSDFVRLGATGVYVFLGNGNGTFTRSIDPMPGWTLSDSASSYPGITGDWNGDGKTDFARLGGTGVYVFLSNGNGTFSRSLVGNPAWDFGTTSANYPPVVGDWNGDGKMDFARLGGTGVYVYLSNGNGTFTTWYDANSGWDFSNAASNYPAVTGDWNGDGKTDIARLGGTGVYVFLSNGNGTFTRNLDGNGGWDFGNTAANYPIQAGDWNGDGRTDLVRLGDTLNYVFLSNGNGTFARSTDLNPGWSFGISSANYPSVALDWNGDGNTDIVRLAGTRVYKFKVAGAVPDVLTTLSNGLGGGTSVSYKPSSSFANTYLPVGVVVQAAAQVTMSDGRSASSTTNYNYAGGLWSNAERRFLGFRKVTTVLNPAGDYTETYYHQHVGCIAKPEISYYRNATGAIYNYSQMYYTEGGVAPYTSLMTERWDYECNLDTACRRVVTQFGYDQYANGTTTIEYGDYDVAGDERTTVRGYVPNTASYLVGYPAYENKYVGIGTGGALAAQSLYLYDSNTTYTAAPSAGKTTRKQLWRNTTSSYLTIAFGYDAWGNEISETSPSGAIKTKTYDATYHMYPLTECDQLNLCSTTEWDYVLASPTRITDENGGVATTTYDSLGRPLHVAKPGGAYDDYNYLNWGDPNLQRVRRTAFDGSADGLWIETYYDGLQRDWRTVQKGGLTTDKVYADASDRVWKRSDLYRSGEAARYTTTTYDGLGRKRRTTNPDGTFAELVYGDGVVTSYDELGHWETRVMDGFGRLKQVQDQAGGVTNHTYDVLDDRISTTDAAGNVTTMTYNSLGQRTQVCDGDIGCTSFQYGSAGLPTSQTDAKGQTITFAYDAASRLVTKTYPNGTQMVVTYDQADHGAGRGRPTTITDPTGSESKSFDWAGRVTSLTKCVQGTCRTIGSSYDALGRLAATTYPDGEVVSYGYAGDGRLASVSGYVNAIAYNAAGQISSITYANGTSATYSYNADRRALTAAQLVGPGGTLYQASYGYDAAARVTSTSSTTNPLMNVSYTYDVLNRLTAVSGAQSQSFTYDALGNITRNSAIGTYSYDASHKHAVAAAGANSYAYDANGNMTSGAGRALVWDYDNRLAQITASGITTSFAYDHQGLRVWKTSPAGDVRTFDDHVELEGSNLIKYYYAGPMLVAKRTPTAAYWYHSDHLGSTKVLSDASGAKVRSYDYAPFGATIATAGSAANDREFEGHKADAGSGLVFMNARYYDPALGRFVSADSMVPDGGNPQALNRYAFAYNSPVMNTDPTGHAPVVAAVVSAIITNTTVAWISAAIVAVGYVTKDPFLMTVGSIMGGFPNPGAMFVAAITSPLSPLNPKLKQAIGWAYTAYNLFDWATSDSKVEAARKATEETRAKFKAMQDAAAQSSGGVNFAKLTYKNVAFGDNGFTAWIAEKLGWTHVTTMFIGPDGSSIRFNVQTSTGGGTTLWGDLRDMLGTMLGKEPVFNMDGFTNSSTLQLVRAEGATLTQFTSFGDAYLANMQLNALPGIRYNPGQSNNAINAANTASGFPERAGPTCFFCK